MERASALRKLAPVLRDAARTLLRAGIPRSGVDPLPASEADMLRAIVREPGLTPGRLAAEVHMKPSNVSTALRHLAELGLVTRECDPADRRLSRVLPTPRAIENAHLIEDAWVRILDEALGELSPDHTEALLRAVPALQALESALRAHPGEAR